MFRVSAFVLVLLFLGSPSFGALYDGPSGKPLSFKQLQYLIQKNRVPSATQAIILLKQQFPQLFKNYILMYRSRSIQPSSLIHPRVLLVGQDAKIIIAFSGDPAHPSFNVLEVMEFIESSRRFEFREIQFSPARSPYISQANPKKCLGCHQGQNRRNIDPRPNWEPYSLWPGAFGSNGSFTDSRLEYDDRIRDEDHQFVKDHKSEEKNYAYFAKFIKPFDSRYRLLGKIDFGFTVQFTESLLKLNYQRVVRLAQESSFYRHYKYAFVAGAKCRHIPWPKSVEKWHEKNNYTPDTIRGLKAPAYDPQAQPDYGHLLPDAEREKFVLRPQAPPKYKERKLTESINLIFDPLGIDTSDWSTDFRTEGGRFAFRERFGIPSNPQAKMSNVLKVLEPELAKLSCKELESKSLQALESFKDLGGLLEASSQVLERIEKKDVPASQVCARCHNDPEESLIPQIPFEDPELLAEHMRSETYPRGGLFEEVLHRTGPHAIEDDQMPPREVLNPRQRQELLEYITEISRQATGR